MHRLLALLIGLILFPSLANGQTYDQKEIKPVKNVILMITDGTSLPTLSTARWLQRYQSGSVESLALDPYFCGTLVTYCSDAPIGDSAPTTSCYMTGVPSLAGFVATYPVSMGENDLFPLDASWQYRPMATLMEITRLEHQRKVGLVMTSEFCHATPADCMAHSYDRRNYRAIIPQMVHSGVDVVIGGGAKYLDDNATNFLRKEGYSVYKNQLHKARQDRSPRTWQLYGERALPYDLDRDPNLYPSLSEMTAIAIEKLTQGENSQNGFFLMVEGSKVDWAAHDNDPIGLVSEFIAFDNAVKVALDFAKKDGNTVVIVTSDHGNSGFSMGREGYPKHYASAPLQEFFVPWTAITRTAEGMATLLNRQTSDELQTLFETYCGISLTDKEVTALHHCKQYQSSPIPLELRDEKQVDPHLRSATLVHLISKIYQRVLPVGFTTHGHTGEEVFLSIYAPQHTGRLIGVNQNYHLPSYMAKLLGVEGEILSYSKRLFAPHDQLLEGYNYSLTPHGESQLPTLVIKLKGRERVEIPAYSNQLMHYKGKKLVATHSLPLASVYVDKTDKVYLSENILTILEALK